MDAYNFNFTLKFFSQNKAFSAPVFFPFLEEHFSTKNYPTMFYSQKFEVSNCSSPFPILSRRHCRELTVGRISTTKYNVSRPLGRSRLC